MKKGLLVNLALSLVVSVVFLGALEGAARLIEGVRPPRPEREVADYIWNWDAKMEGQFYTMRSEAVGWPPYQQFNGHGLRDRTRARELPEGFWRVAILGDSVTLGADLPRHEAFPQLLEARLRRRGRRTEVMNVGLWGWSTRQERIAWHRIVRGYAPDQVILAVCLNDIPELHNNLTRPPAWVFWLFERSALVRLLVDAEGREIENVERLFLSPDDPRVQDAFEGFFDEVRALRREVEDDGAEFAVIVFPFRFQLEEAAPVPVVQQRIESFCESEGLTCLDMLPILERLGPSAFLDYDHLSRAGASLAADALLASALFPPGRTGLEALETHLIVREVAAGEVVAEWLRTAEGPVPPEGRASLAEALGAGDPDARRAAAWALGRLDRGGAEAPAELIDAVRTDPDSGVRAEAAAALGALGPAGRQGVPALFDALDDVNEGVRHAAARALAAQKLSLDHLDPLMQALESDDTFVRAFAAWRLGNFGEPAAGAVPALAAVLEKPDTHVVVSASLARIGPGAVKAVPVLVDDLSSPDPSRRWRAARALGRIGPGASSAVPDLSVALSDTNGRVRRHAARALGRIGSSAASDALQRATRDGDAGVRNEARKALEQLD